jgi:hypothetical protein
MLSSIILGLVIKSNPRIQGSVKNVKGLSNCIGVVSMNSYIL